MCDQSEIEYFDGEIVWVKFQRLWWPAEVVGDGEQPAKLYRPNRKPKLVVQFFTEQTYECVYSLEDVYRYDCRRKDEFLKKGYALYLERKPNMHLFVQDVKQAELKIKGDPDILKNEKYHPPPRPNYSSIFGSRTPKQKKIAANVGRGRGRRKASVAETPPTNSMPTTKNPSFRAAHTTPTLSQPFYGPSTSAIYRTPQSATTSSNTYKCTYASCKFETTRLNNLITHNKFHANDSEEKTVTPAKAKKTPVVSSTKKTPAKPAPESSDDNDYDLEISRKKTPQKRGRKPGQKKGMAKKSVVTPTVKVEIKPKTPRRSRKVIEILPQETPKPKPEKVLEPIEIKSKILADWSEDEDEDDNSMPSISNQPTESTGTKSLEDSSPNQSGDEKHKSPKAIRNIPKKDRRGNILDEFYSSQVPGTHAAEKEEENGQEATILIDSDDEIIVSPEDHVESRVNDDEKQQSASDNEVIEQPEEPAQEEEKQETIEIDSPIIIEDEEIVDKITGKQSPVEELREQEIEENNDDLELLKQSADLLEETSQLQKNIESVGIIEKKRRLQIKHKADDDSDNVDNSTGFSIEIESANDESTTEFEPKSQSEPESDKNDLEPESDKNDLDPESDKNDLEPESDKNDLEPDSDKTELEPESSELSKTVELPIEDKSPSISNSHKDQKDETCEPTSEEKQQTEDEMPTNDEPNDSVEETIETIAPPSQEKQEILVEEEPPTNKEPKHDPADEIMEESEPNLKAPVSEKPKCEEPKLEKLEENDLKLKSEKLILDPEIESKIELKEIKNETINENDKVSQERRRSSARLRSPIQNEPKTYRSTRRKTKSTSSEIIEAKPESKEIIIPTAMEVVETIPEELEESEEPKVELIIEKLVETTIEMADETNNDNEMKAEDESTSPTKSDLDSSKTDVDCFDFKEEDEEIPQTLNRRKRRFLTPGKVFELQPVDKLEEIRRQEEEKCKRIKLDKEETTKDIILEMIPIKNDDDSVAVQSSDQNSSPEKSPEKQLKDDDMKDKTLPPKERGKRIFKSRNRNRLSEGELFSSEDKIKELSLSSESIEKLSIDPINDIPKMRFDEEPVIIVGAAEITIETQQKEVEQSTTVEQENEQIESEIANTLITMTASTSGQSESGSSSFIEPVPEPDTSVKITISLDQETKPDADEKDDTLPSPSKKKRKSTNELTESASSEVSIPSEPINPPQPVKRHVPSPKTTLSNTPATVNTIIVESTETTVPDMEIIAESPKPLKIESPKPTSQFISKPGPSDITPMTSSSPPIKKKSQRSSKKVPVKIGYDVHGNEIITYRYPSDKPVVHLPSHIQTPDMVQSAINPRMMHKKEPPSPQMATTSRGVISQAPSTSGTVRQTIQTKTPSRNHPQVQRTVLQQPEQMHHIIINEQPVQRSVNLQQQQQQQQQQQMRNILQMQAKQNVRTQKPQASTSTGHRTMPNARVGRQPKRQPEVAPVQVQQETDSPENQLLAVPAENFNGPPGAFFLCSTVSGKIQPIDRTALYLDKNTNQLMPAPLDVAGLQEAAAIQDVAGLQDVVTMQDEISEEDPTVQEYAAQEEQIASNAEEGGVRYMLVLGDGERILLDQQCYEQLTQGQVPTLVTPDGQQLMLQIQQNDLSSAVQLNQPEMSQIIINDGTISGDENNQDILATAMAGSDFPPEQYMGEMMQQIESASMEVEPLGFQTINQASTSETNAILEQPPIMSTLVQPSKKDVPSTSVDCSNLDASLAVIGVSAPTTNVPTSLELPITVTNPNIAPKTTTSAIRTIYPSNVPTTLPIGSLTSELISPSLGIVGDTIEIEHPEDIQIVQLEQNVDDIDATSEIVPNTPETENNHNFISDNSNSSEIPLQSELILISNDNMSGTEIRNGNRIAQNNHEQNRCNNRNNNQTDVNAIIINDNSFDNHDAALLLNVNSHSGYQRSQNHSRNNPNHSRNNRNGRNRPNLSRANAQESHSFIIDENVIGTNEFDANDVEMSDR